MKYPTITIEGNILSAELLEELEREASHQNPRSFGLELGQRVKDEIARAWGEVLLQWQIFQSKQSRLKRGATGTSETRQFWMVPFLDTLGYQLTYQPRAEVVNGQTYDISHRDLDIGSFPVHIVGFHDSLDKRRESGGPRLSPHALVQEYLNVSEHLYAVVTNGYRLRLLRDSSRLTRLSYLEFDLQGMMEEEVYADFAILYRLLHRSRMPQREDAGAESVIEHYHQLALDSGARIRNRLSSAVKDGIERMGNALLQHQENTELRERLASGDLTAPELYSQLLRLVYRLLFLLVIEERDLVFPKNGEEKEGTDGQLSPREVYSEFYSISRLRKLAENRHLVDGRKEDLWISLMNTFRLFESRDIGRRLGIPPLAGELFGADALNDLLGTRLRNDVLLYCLSRLIRFQNDQGIWTRVNYAALNVEEFGSVYEGLLEYQPYVDEGSSTKSGRGWSFGFREGGERSTTGSHYTPDELVRPLVEHALDPVIEKKLKAVGDDRKSIGEALLSLKVCDVACGSGHFLLAAARWIAHKLAQVRTGEEQPNPAALRRATRDVIRRCIYGVDKNPMAVELCKVALWLEAHDPGKPLTFLDHRIKCGDAIVGMAHADDLKEGIPDEAFKTLDGDDKEVAKTLRDRNKRERKQRTSMTLQLELGDEVATDLKEIAARYRQFETKDDDTLEARKAKEAAYAGLSGPEWMWLKQLADAKVAPFFLRKTLGNKDRILTDGPYRRLLHSKNAFQGRQDVAAASGVGAEKRFFHWFLEFPEVFDTGGFDCILGNPPFLGNRKLKGTFGDDFLPYVTCEYAPAGAIDLVGYFFRRIFNLLKEGGALGCIATNTLAQGNAREGGLAVILDEGGTINFAVRSMKWPGVAALEVALVTIHKGSWNGGYVLDEKSVETINSYLSDEEPLPDPHTLAANANKSFQGSVVLGMGFVLEPEEAERLLERDPRNAEVLFPYLNGSDLNSSPDQAPSRWVINFFDWPVTRAQEYPDCYQIVEKQVKPERQRWKKDKNGSDIVGTYALRKPLPQRWWHYADKRPLLYRTIAPLERVLVVALTTKAMAFAFQPANIVYAHATGIFALDGYDDFALLQSSFHEQWAWKNASTLESRLRYTPSSVFETFPFPCPTPEQKAALKDLGKRHYTLRQNLMQRLQLGLTKMYNLFHDSEIDAAGVQKAAAVELDEATAEEALEDLRRLRALHKEMDEVVRDAYGWSDLDLGHGFHEVDFLPENDRIRYTISPQARKTVLRRLLKLNHQRYAEEQEAKKTVKAQRVETKA